MQLKDSIVFVTGANRGLGLEFARQALAGGARKVYAAARRVDSVTLAGVVPIPLDVTDAAQARAAAEQCHDVTLVVNNAGIGRTGGILAEDAEALLRDQLETNLFGMLHVCRAFAGPLARNGGGAIVNILSLLSWINTPMLGAYGVTKSAAWALTNSLRQELAAQKTQVLGFHGGFIDTDMIRGFEVPKSRPEDVVRATYAALEAGESEVAVDAATRQVKEALAQGVYLREALAA